jgi:hypothetical protein
MASVGPDDLATGKGWRSPMSSQSVAQGDREPAESPGPTPKNSDVVSARGRSLTDLQGVESTRPGIGDEGEVEPSASDGGSPAPRTRGSPGESTRRKTSATRAAGGGLTGILSETLQSDEMTSRACRLMITAAVGLAIVVVPVASVAFIIMVKAPADWKILLGAGSTVFITIGSWLFGRRRRAKKSRQSAAAGQAQ